MVKRAVALALSMALSQASLAQQPMPTVEALRFLIGKWAGEGTAEVGPGSGYFTFESSLKDRTLIRKNHAEYPATAGRPVVTHDDLLVVYADSAGGKLRGFYTDSEGNTINYVVTISADRKTILFMSDPRDPAPHYRLTYVVTQPDTMTLSFEAGSASNPDDFKKFIEGVVRRVR